MSETKKGGLFINKKAAAASTAAPAAPTGTKPKDVKRRWMYVGIGAIGVVVVASTMFGNKPEPKRSSSKKEDAANAAMISVTPANADKAAFEANFAKELESLRKGQEDMKKELANKDRELEKLKTNPTANDPNLPSGVVGPPTMPTGNSGGLGTVAPPLPPTANVRNPQSIGYPVGSDEQPWNA